MNLTSPNTIKLLLEKYKTRPNKIMGQNFLIDKNILDKIIKTADINENDTILEVGPGIGTLTKELAEKAKQIICVEKDKTMCEILKETVKLRNLEIINTDILSYKLGHPLGLASYKVIANIPYYLTSPLIRKLLESKNQPKEIILMVQKEVAQRICSNPPDMSLLSVSVQFYAEPKIISYVSKNCFMPSPKVDSAIIKITPRAPSSQEFLRARGSHELFFKVVKAGFSHPRKQILKNLSKQLNLTKEQTEKWLERNGIKPTQRAETMSIENWINLTNTINDFI